MSKLALLGLIVVLQVCAMKADLQPTDGPEEESRGILERARDTYQAAKDKAKYVTAMMSDFAAMYYEDHIKPVTDPYVTWAKDKAGGLRDTAGSFWENVKNRLSS